MLLCRNKQGTSKKITRLRRAINSHTARLSHATESLRDKMTNMELILNMLVEATTTEISKERNPETRGTTDIITLK